MSTPTTWIPEETSAFSGIYVFLISTSEKLWLSQWFQQLHIIRFWCWFKISICIFCILIKNSNWDLRAYVLFRSYPCAKTFFWNIWERNGCLYTHAWKVIGNHCAPFFKNKNHKPPSWHGTEHARFLSERHELYVSVRTYGMVAGKAFGSVPLAIVKSPSSYVCWL